MSTANRGLMICRFGEGIIFANRNDPALAMRLAANASDFGRKPQTNTARYDVRRVRIGSRSQKNNTPHPHPDVMPGCG